MEIWIAQEYHGYVMVFSSREKAMEWAAEHGGLLPDGMCEDEEVETSHDRYYYSCNGDLAFRVMRTYLDSGDMVPF